MHDVKAQFSTASIVGKDRAVFNIAGNKYRLVVLIRCDKDLLYIRFIGTHPAYDRINVHTI